MKAKKELFVRIYLNTTTTAAEDDDDSNSSSSGGGGGTALPANKIEKS